MWQCAKPCNNDVWPAPPKYRFNVDMKTMLAPPGDNNSTPEIEAWKTNIPICPNCKEFARPNVLMFGDYGWVSNSRASKRYSAWRQNVSDLLATNPDWKLTIVEVGCGLNVPSGKKEQEYLLLKIQ